MVMSSGITVDLSASHGLPSVTVAELKKLKDALRNEESGGRRRYIHGCLDASRITLPVPSTPPRNAEMDARVQKLRDDQMNKEYNDMVKDVSSPLPENREVVGSTAKVVNAQIAVVVNFVLTVVGSFIFTYKAVEYALHEPSVPIQVLAGLMAGIVVAIADLFFILRYTI